MRRGNATVPDEGVSGSLCLLIRHFSACMIAFRVDLYANGALLKTPESIEGWLSGLIALRCGGRPFIGSLNEYRSTVKEGIP